MCSACVPLPEPGGPTRMTIMSACLGEAATANAAGAGAGEALVVSGDEVRFDLVGGVERDAADNHERGAPVGHRLAKEPRGDEIGRDADACHVGRTTHGDALHDRVDVVGGLLARTDAGDVRLLL